ncbi:MAG: histidinol-phosphate transaminase [Caulobacteraceae bacterium]
MRGPAPKPTILQIEPYRPGRATAPGFPRPIKISANENPLGASPAARAAYAEAQRSLHLYPDPRANALRQALAAKHGLDPQRIIFGTGSDEIFAMACQAYLQPGDTMVQPQYAFAAWAIAARSCGAVVRSAPERDYHVDIDAMLASVDGRTRVMFIANPANPTGTRIPASEIRRLHAGLHPDILLVLDGAYAEFDDDDNEFAVYADAPNVLITRTFSKVYGLAALRIGWGCAPAPVIDVLNRIRLPFNASMPAQAAALAALGDGAFVANSVAHAVRGRERLAALLESLDLVALPSAGNFVTARFPPDAPISARTATANLAERGVLVRGLEPYGMPDCIRVSVCAEKDWAQVERALHGTLGGSGAA